ncbi:MAG: VOC family protein [Gammaproteobacteria bacterium]|nr:MAG: VOC family protein [Gammaproteobacteria bacterium]
MLLIAALVLGASFTPGQVARAAPVPEDERIPIDIRRTTLLVRDIERSLPVYRDALGLTVIYDEYLGGGTDADGQPQPATTRLVLLRANDTFIGALGLMQRLDIEPPPPPENRRAMPGDVILVINALDLEERFERIADTPGVTVATAPTRVEYPAPDGGVIPVLFSAFWDPDGYFIEVNRILGTPAGVPTAEE